MLKKEGSIFETVIKAVSAEGKLLTVDAADREFDFGEVEWVYILQRVQLPSKAVIVITFLKLSHTYMPIKVR